MKVVYSVLFSIALIGCSRQSDDVSIVWDNDRAVAVRIGHHLLTESRVLDSITVHVYDERDAILGDAAEDDGSVLFTPLIPFTGGLSYGVRYGSREVATFEVPIDTTLSAPELLGIYPSADTVPENLLKMYFNFSEPMMEGKAASRVYLIRNDTDTLRDVFLDLQPELWNEESTVLTLWLDPGRVKRDLIPNKILGTPIEQSSTYRLVVKEHWRSRQGAHTQSDYLKVFHVGTRDEKIPDVGDWKLRVPKAQTRDTLHILFNESIDFKLMTDAIHVIDGQRRLLEGEKLPSRSERALLFIPLTNWEQGIYSVMIESRLEDLAGNNLTRLFDRDVTRESADPEAEAAIEIPLEIR